MKLLACVCMFLLSCVAEAQTTVDLPSPVVNTYYPTTTVNCHYPVSAWTSASGFSADGNYVNGISYGYVACGHSGRGSNLVYTYYCMFDVWDLAGNVVSVTVQPYATCYTAMQSQPQFVTWTNAGGYEAHTITNVYYGNIQSRYAVLVTP